MSAAETFRIQAAETLVKRANAAEADMHNASLQELTAWAQRAVPRRAHILGMSRVGRGGVPSSGGGGSFNSSMPVAAGRS